MASLAELSAAIPSSMTDDNEEVSSMCSTVDYMGIEYEGFWYDPSLSSAAKSPCTTAKDVATPLSKTFQRWNDNHEKLTRQKTLVLDKDRESSVKIHFGKCSLLDYEGNNSEEASGPGRTSLRNLVIQVLDSNSEIELRPAKQDVEVLPTKTNQVIVLDSHHDDIAANSSAKALHRKRRLTTQQNLTDEEHPMKKEQEIISLLSSDDEVAYSVKPIQRRNRKLSKQKASTDMAFQKEEEEVILLLSDDDETPQKIESVQILPRLVDKDVKDCCRSIALTRERIPPRDKEVSCNHTLHDYLHKLVHGRGSRAHIATVSRKSI